MEDRPHNRPCKQIQKITHATGSNSQADAAGNTIPQARRVYIRSNPLLNTWFSDINNSLGHQALEQLFGLGQADGVVANVVDTVPTAQE